MCSTSWSRKAKSSGNGWKPGACFYVCGDASRMAKDVDNALHEVIQTWGHKTPEEAAAYVADMKQHRRYQRDVY